MVNLTQSIGINGISEKKQHFLGGGGGGGFTIQNLTQSRKDAYPNKGLRLQNVPNAEKTHISIHTGTHTHKHGTHTPIDIHYNIYNVSAGK